MPDISVLVGCEFSGTMRDAFARQGFNSWSCDVLPDDDDSEFHLRMDIHKALDFGHWDLVILHPPCTALAVSGNRHYNEGKPKHKDRLRAMDWTRDLWDHARNVCRHVALENPVGVLKHVIGKASQYVQPYQFGHGETKRTGFWLWNLPKLTPTDEVDGREQRMWLLPPSKDRWKIRSTTYTGIANACADQWGSYVKEQLHEPSKR